MQWKVIAVFLLASASVALGVKCEPKMWKADFLGKVGNLNNGQTTVLSIGGTFFKDADRKMEVAIEMVQSDTYVANITYIRDGNSGMAYVVTNGMNCTKEADPAGSVIHLCTDTPGLTPVGTLNVGTYNLDLYNYRGTSGETTLSIERQSFMYINGVTVQTFMGNTQMIAMQYGNMSTTDIPGSVFNIPSICNMK